jgi:hypothetical protein
MPAATSAAPSTAPCAWDRSMAKPQPLQCVRIVDYICVGGCIVAWWFEGVRQLAKQCRNSSSWIQPMLGTRNRDSTRPLYSPQVELHGSTHMTTLPVFILLLPDHVDWRQHPSAVRWIWGEAENLDKLWVCQPGQAGAGDKGQGQYSSLVLTPG